MQAGKHRNNAGRQACQTSSAEAISTLAWGSVARILLKLKQARERLRRVHLNPSVGFGSQNPPQTKAGTVGAV